MIVRGTLDAVARISGFQAYSGGSLGIYSAVNLANVAGTSLDLNGKVLVVGSLSGGGAAGGTLNLSSYGSLVFGGGSFVNNVTTVASTSVFAGQVTGTGSLAVTGGGTLKLANSANNFTGQVNVISGTLAVSGLGALGSPRSIDALEAYRRCCLYQRLAWWYAHPAGRPRYRWSEQFR